MLKKILFILILASSNVVYGQTKPTETHTPVGVNTPDLPKQPEAEDTNGKPVESTEVQPSGEVVNGQPARTNVSNTPVGVKTPDVPKQIEAEDTNGKPAESTEVTPQ